MSEYQSAAGAGLRVCLFEDAAVAGLEPLTLTRPAFDLLSGLTSLGEKQRRAFDAGSAGALVRPYLTDITRLHHPDLAVNDTDWLREGPAVLVNARWLPPSDRGDKRPACPPWKPASEPLAATAHVGVLGDQLAWAVLGKEHLARCSPETLADCLEEWKATLPHREAGGRLVRHLWELVHWNGEQIATDFAHRPRLKFRATALSLVGPAELLSVDPSARADPFVVADTTGGPVVVEAGAVVGAFSRLEGPCRVGAGTHVLGAKVRAGTTLGPHCRVGGEVEASIVQGHSNKYHDGFLGHGYVGAWVNLGADTSNSDLRNDYGEVTVTVAGRRVPTGMTKVGCFLGDHTKTGLGTLLNTGTSVGAFCNLLPSGGLLPKYVPSFASWWNGALTENADLPELLTTTAKVMARRGITLTPAHEALYRAVFEQTAPERRRALREAEQRRLRRSA